MIRVQLVRDGKTVHEMIIAPGQFTEYAPGGVKTFAAGRSEEEMEAAVSIPNRIEIDEVRVVT